MMVGATSLKYSAADLNTWPRFGTISQYWDQSARIRMDWPRFGPISQDWDQSAKIGTNRPRLGPNRPRLGPTGQNRDGSDKTGTNQPRLGPISQDWDQSTKIGTNRQRSRPILWKSMACGEILDSIHNWPYSKQLARLAGPHLLTAKHVNSGLLTDSRGLSVLATRAFV
jgi:hypothetical protein